MVHEPPLASPIVPSWLSWTMYVASNLREESEGYILEGSPTAPRREAHSEPMWPSQGQGTTLRATPMPDCQQPDMASNEFLPYIMEFDVPMNPSPGLTYLLNPIRHKSYDRIVVTVFLCMTWTSSYLIFNSDREHSEIFDTRRVKWQKHRYCDVILSASNGTFRHLYQLSATSNITTNCGSA